MNTQQHNQAMEPVGTQALHPAADPHHTAAGGAHVAAPAATHDVYESGRLAFTGREVLYGVVVFAGILAILAGVGALMATVVALLHKLFKAFMDDPLAAANWGNAIGTTLLVSLVFVMILATLLTMGERKWSALIQDRMGPNQARLPGIKHPLFGLPHIAADVLKMLTKEEIVPAMGSKLLFHLSPALAFAPAFVLFAVVPMSPTFTWMGERISLMIASYPVLENGVVQFVGIDQGLIYLLAVASIAVFGVTLAGWSSNNKYALLGGIRASAQMISYEVTLGLTLVGLMIVFETVRLDAMTALQGELMWGWLPAWGVFFQPLAILAYFAAATAEMKRAPFDLPEGESEIVGYFIEYSGLKFGIFMIGEFVEVVVFAGVFAALFFGGYHLPWGEGWILANWGEAALGLIQLVTFMAKTVFFCWLSLVIRWTFPRFRYDQVMNLGWKILLPLSLLNVVLTGVVTLAWGREGAMVFGLLQLALVGFYIIGGFGVKRVGGETALPQTDRELEHAAHGHAHADHAAHPAH